jgi:branched-chain amino acid transport system permease protein
VNRLGTPVLIVVLGLLLVAGIGGFLPSYYVGLTTESLIVALFVMSLDLLVGFTGLESLGHAAFFGVGA